MHQGNLHFSRTLFLISISLFLSSPSSANRILRGTFFFPGLFLPETERLLVDVPLFIQFERLVRELNFISRELERDALRAESRERYQRTLDEAARVEKELTSYLHEQNVVAEEIDKLHG